MHDKKPEKFGQHAIMVYARMNLNLYGSKEKAKHYINKTIKMLKDGKVSMSEAQRKREIANMELVIECYDNVPDKDILNYVGAVR